MSSAVRLPVSYNVSTFGGASQDYTSIEAWEADTDNDLVTAGAGEVLKVTDDESVYEWTTQATFAFAGATANADYFRAVIYHENNTNRPYIHRTYYNTRFKEDYFGWHVDFRANFTGKYYRAALSIQADQCRVANCNIKSTWVGVKTETGNGTSFLINVCIHNCGYVGFYGNAGIAHLYNVTAANNDTRNYEDGAGNNHAKNCIAAGAGFSSGWYIKNCVTSGVQFVDEANEDYRLAASDTVAKDQGLDLSADSVFAFDDDLLGVQRPQGSAWDIGAYEYVLPNAPPDAPTEPFPENNQVGVAPGGVTLSCTVSDPDDDTLDVSFYNAADDSLIGEDTGVSSGDTASVIWPDRDSGTIYSWYVVVDDGLYTVVGSTWTFTVANVPQGQVYITFKAKKPTMTFTAKKPSMAFTARKPIITFDV